MHDPDAGLEHPLGYFGGCFLLFRGAELRPEWIDDWRECKGLVGLKNPLNGRIDEELEGKPGYVRLPSNTFVS